MSMIDIDGTDTNWTLSRFGMYCTSILYTVPRSQSMHVMTLALPINSPPSGLRQVPVDSPEDPRLV